MGGGGGGGTGPTSHWVEATCVFLETFSLMFSYVYLETL